MNEMFDVAIIGSGPAGMTAAIYAQRFNLKTIVLEKNAPGGAMINTEVINNYPGFKNISGVDLSMSMYEQMTDLNCLYDSQDVKKIEIMDKPFRHFKIVCESDIYAKNVIIATGTREKTIDIPSEKRFFHKGISWCAICDGPLYKGQDVAVIGGGNSAISSAITLAKFCQNVFVIHRRDTLRASDDLVKAALQYKNIKLLYNCIVNEFLGDDNLTGVKLLNIKTNEETILNIACAFEFVGSIPNTNTFKELIDLDENGYILTNENRETNVKGIFACGDVIVKTVRQIATAVADGAIAAISCANQIK